MTTNAQRDGYAEAAGRATWKQEVAAALVDNGIEVVTVVPDARVSEIVGELEALGADVRTLTREEECIGYAAGYAMAGGRPAVLMQCSGLGNALNAIGSLAIPYGIGLPMIISMRGTLGVENPAQVHVGRATQGFLTALGVQWVAARYPWEVAALTEGVVEFCSSTSSPSALLLEPTLHG